MEQKKGSRGLVKVAIVSAVTAALVVTILFAAVLGAYYFLCCEPVSKTADAPASEGVTDRIERTARTISGSATDGAKITSISFSTWSHAGPLYPDPNEPPGYVSGISVSFRRDLTAGREKKKDYDRDLPDEVTNESAILTADQFEKLADVCAYNDILYEADSRNNRTEGGTTLIIEYDGQTKAITTSNMGSNSPAVANVLWAFKELEKSLTWTAKK